MIAFDSSSSWMGTSCLSTSWVATRTLVHHVLTNCAGSSQPWALRHRHQAVMRSRSMTCWSQQQQQQQQLGRVPPPPWPCRTRPTPSPGQPSAAMQRRRRRQHAYAIHGGCAAAGGRHQEQRTLVRAVGQLPRQYQLLGRGLRQRLHARARHATGGAASAVPGRQTTTGGGSARHTTATGGGCAVQGTPLPQAGSVPHTCPAGVHVRASTTAASWAAPSGCWQQQTRHNMQPTRHHQGGVGQGRAARKWVAWGGGSPGPWPRRPAWSSGCGT